MEQKIVDGIVNVFRGKASINNQSVVLCCPNCTPNERDRIIEDILSPDYGCDCVVRYAENTTELGKAEIERLVKNSALLVFYVNQKTIDDRKNGILFYEYDFADKNNTPIIPIVHADRKRDFSAAFDKDGEKTHGIQYFEDGSEGRLTEYKEKLKKEFDKYITEQGTVKNIKSNAFKAKIFLSYRQKDNSVKKGTHIVDDFLEKFYAVPEFEAVSVWYDKYLDAGEDYADEIREAIDDCDVFALIVTENMLAEGNYVIKHEYPYALKKQWDIQNITENLGEKGYYKPIVAVFAETVDEDRLFERFTGIDKFPSGSFDSEESRTALFGYFKEILGEKLNTESTSEQLYYLGEAYLNGVGVVRDVKKGISVLERVAETFSDKYAYHAANDLSIYFKDGNIIDSNLKKAIMWRKRIHNIYSFKLKSDMEIESEVSKNPRLYYPNVYESVDILIDNFIPLGEMYLQNGDYPEALNNFNNCIKEAEKLFAGKDFDSITDFSPGLIQVYPRIGYTYYQNTRALGNQRSGYEEAKKWFDKAITKYEKHYNIETLDSYQEKFYTEKTDSGDKKIYYSQERVLDDFAEFSSACLTFSQLLVEFGDLENALLYANKSLYISEKMYGNGELLVAKAYAQVGSVYLELKDYDSAIKYYENVLKIEETKLGKEHFKTETTYLNLGQAYSLVSDNENYKVKAENYIMTWRKICTNHYGNDEALGKYTSLGIKFLDLGVPDKAEKVFDEVLYEFDMIYGALHQRTLETNLNFAVNSSAKGFYSYSNKILSKIGYRLENNQIFNEAANIITDALFITGINVVYNQIESGFFEFSDILSYLTKLAIKYNITQHISKFANLYNIYASKLSDEHRYNEAYNSYIESINIYKICSGEKSRNTTAVLYNIGKMHYSYAGWMSQSGKYYIIDVKKVLVRGLEFSHKALDISNNLPHNEESLTSIIQSLINDLEYEINNLSNLLPI